MGVETHEIRTLEEFRGFNGRPVGANVVTDTPTGTTRAHRTSCRTINDEMFFEKVLENGAENGRYYFLVRFEDAERSLGGLPCGVCR